MAPKTRPSGGTSAPLARAALRLVALTGLRREEACSLRWAEVDEAGRCLRLESTKTGRSTRPVGRAALELLRTLPRPSETWVFPGRDGAGRADLKKALAGLFEAAGLAGVRSHDLRRRSPARRRRRSTRTRPSASCWATRGAG